MCAVCCEDCSLFLLSDGPHAPCELANAGSGCEMMSGLVPRERAVAWIVSVV